MKWLLLFACSVLFSAQLRAQSANSQAVKNDNSLKYVFAYFGNYQLSPKWGLYSEVQFRMDENLKFSNQNVYRAALIRYLKQGPRLLGGYACLTTYSAEFGDYFSEHRFWEQIDHARKINRRTMSGFIRLEQRFVEQLEFSGNNVQTSHYNYGNRIRFAYRETFDLTKNPAAENVFYIALHDEPFLNFAAPGLNKNLFDQNRLLALVGLLKNNHTRLHLGYVYVWLNPYKADDIVVHNLLFELVQTLDFTKKE